VSGDTPRGCLFSDQDPHALISARIIAQKKTPRVRGTNEYYNSRSDGGGRRDAEALTG
jgi:hypothetical protein